MNFKKYTNKIKEALESNKILKNVLILTSGATVGYLIILLTSPILTRLYSPEEFGVLALYISVVGVLTPLITLKYELAIPLAPNERAAIAIVLLSFILAFIMSVLLFLFFFLLKDEVAILFGLDSTYEFLWLLILGLFGSGVYQILNLYAMRAKAYKIISKTRFYQNLGMATIQIGTGFFKWGVLGLLLGHFFGRVSGSSNLYRILKLSLSSNIRQMSFQYIYTQLSRYKKFGIYSSIAGSINVAGTQIMPVLLTLLYSQEMVGQFSLGVRIVSVPMVLLGGSLSNVFLAEGAEMVRETPEKLSHYFKNISKGLLLWGAVPLAILCLSSPYLFPVVFGENWDVAGKYVLIMFPAFLGQLIISPLSSSLNLVEKPSLQLLGDLLRVAIVISGIYASYRLGLTHYVVITIYSISLTLTYVIYYYLYKHGLRKV